MGCQSCFEDESISDKLFQINSQEKRAPQSCDLFGWFDSETKRNTFAEKVRNPPTSQSNRNQTEFSTGLGRNAHTKKCVKEYVFHHYEDVHKYIVQYRNEHIILQTVSSGGRGQNLQAVRQQYQQHLQQHYQQQQYQQQQLQQQQAASQAVPYYPAYSRSQTTLQPYQDQDSFNAFLLGENESVAGLANQRNISATYMNGVFSVAQKYHLTPPSLVQYANWWRGVEQQSQSMLPPPQQPPSKGASTHTPVAQSAGDDGTNRRSSEATNGRNTFGYSKRKSTQWNPINAVRTVTNHSNIDLIAQQSMIAMEPFQNENGLNGKGPSYGAVNVVPGDISQKEKVRDGTNLEFARVLQDKLRRLQTELQQRGNSASDPRRYHLSANGDRAEIDECEDDYETRYTRHLEVTGKQTHYANNGALGRPHQKSQQQLRRIGSQQPETLLPSLPQYRFVSVLPISTSEDPARSQVREARQW